MTKLAEFPYVTFGSANQDKQAANIMVVAHDVDPYMDILSRYFLEIDRFWRSDPRSLKKESHDFSFAFELETIEKPVDLLKELQYITKKKVIVGAADEHGVQVDRDDRYAVLSPLNCITFPDLIESVFDKKQVSYFQTYSSGEQIFMQAGLKTRPYGFYSDFAIIDLGVAL